MSQCKNATNKNQDSESSWEILRLKRFARPLQGLALQESTFDWFFKLKTICNVLRSRRSKELRAFYLYTVHMGTEDVQNCYFKAIKTSRVSWRVKGRSGSTDPFQLSHFRISHNIWSHIVFCTTFAHFHKIDRRSCFLCFLFSIVHSSVPLSAFSIYWLCTPYSVTFTV